MDPETGPFTETELQAIHVALNAAYAAGKITNRQAALAWLFIGIGPRPVQIADLKVKDVESKGSTGEFVVNIPRVKQRYLPKRSEFKKRPLLKDIAEIVAAWIEEVKLIGADRVPEIDAGELPMFPEWHQPNAPGFEHHSNGETLGSELSSIFDNLIVTSHRTKGPMSITPYRFRYTLGKRAAEEGYGDLVIADLLDHSGTGCVWIYVHFGPRTMKILNKALAKEFSWLGAAFGGKIVRNEGSTDRVSTIRAPGMAPQNAGVGRCGGCGDCTGMAPVACYVCPIFEAFVDGPHEEVLDYLLSDQERILAETGDERIAHANDHIILAVAKVLQLCNEINGAAQ
jgi:hypothetical protein